MESRFFIFLAFASLPQFGSSKLTPSSALSEDQLAVLYEIKANQKASFVAYYDGFKPVFDRVDKLAGKLTHNLKAKTHKNSGRIIFKGRIRAKQAVDLFFDSVLLVPQGKSCAILQSARNGTHNDLDDAFARITIALKLASKGNNNGNRDEIEAHQAAVRQDFDKLNDRTYDSICVCFDTCKDADTRVVIRNAQDASRVGLYHLANGVFNAIKEYAAAVTAGHAEAYFVFDTKDIRGKVLVGIKSDAENKFSALQTFYMNSDPELAGRGIVPELASINSAWTVATNRYNEAMIVAFGTLDVYFRRVILGFNYDGEDDFSRTDVDMRTVIAEYEAGDLAIFSSLLVLYPTLSAQILTAQNVMFTFEDVGVGGYYDAVYAAVGVVGNYTETVERIENIRKIVVPLAFSYSDFFFRFIRQDRSLGQAINTELKDLNDIAIRVDEVNMSTFFDAVQILARATDAGVVTDDDLAAVQALLVASNGGLDDFCDAVAAASLIALKASTAN